MYNLVILKPAAEELKDASEWYEKRQPGLGKRFQKHVFLTFRSIQKQPLLFAVKFSEVFRFATVEVFPFLIVFEIQGNNVVINAIFHTSRNPSRF